LNGNPGVSLGGINRDAVSMATGRREPPRVYKETSGHVPLSAQAFGHEAGLNVLAYGRILKKKVRKRA
jgi:hypothetical protein